MINPGDKKWHTVFISSTYKDLVEERDCISKNLIGIDCIPIGMEAFPASDDDPLTYIKKMIDIADYYILILAGKYGDIPQNSENSMIELEYEYALGKDKCILVFPHQDFKSMDASKREAEGDLLKKLLAFYSKVNQKLTKQWTSKDNLTVCVMQAIFNAKKTSPTLGWTRDDGKQKDELILSLREQVNTKVDYISKLEEEKNQLLVEVGNFSLNSNVPDIDYEIPFIMGTNKFSLENKKSTHVNLKDIFRIIAPSLLQTPMNVNTLLGEYSSIVSELFPDLAKQHYISTQTRDEIKVMLLSKGLINVVTGSTVGGGVGVFWSLTELGAKAVYRLIDYTSIIHKLEGL